MRYAIFDGNVGKVCIEVSLQCLRVKKGVMDSENIYKMNEKRKKY